MGSLGGGSTSPRSNQSTVGDHSLNLASPGGKLVPVEFETQLKGYVEHLDKLQCKFGDKPIWTCDPKMLKSNIELCFSKLVRVIGEDSTQKQMQEHQVLHDTFIANQLPFFRMFFTKTIELDEENGRFLYEPGDQNAQVSAIVSSFVASVDHFMRKDKCNGITPTTFKALHEYMIDIWPQLVKADYMSSRDRPLSDHEPTFSANITLHSHVMKNIIVSKFWETREETFIEENIKKRQQILSDKIRDHIFQNLKRPLALEDFEDKYTKLIKANLQCAPKSLREWLDKHCPTGGWNEELETQLGTLIGHNGRLSMPTVSTWTDKNEKGGEYGDSTPMRVLLPLLRQNEEYKNAFAEGIKVYRDKHPDFAWYHFKMIGGDRVCTAVKLNDKQKNYVPKRLDDILKSLIDSWDTLCAANDWDPNISVFDFKKETLKLQFRDDNGSHTFAAWEWGFCPYAASLKFGYFPKCVFLEQMLDDEYGWGDFLHYIATTQKQKYPKSLFSIQGDWITFESTDPNVMSTHKLLTSDFHCLTFCSMGDNMLKSYIWAFDRILEHSPKTIGHPGSYSGATQLVDMLRQTIHLALTPTFNQTVKNFWIGTRKKRKRVQ